MISVLAGRKATSDDANLDCELQADEPLLICYHQLLFLEDIILKAVLKGQILLPIRLRVLTDATYFGL